MLALCLLAAVAAVVLATENCPREYPIYLSDGPHSYRHKYEASKARAVAFYSAFNSHTLGAHPGPGAILGG